MKAIRYKLFLVRIIIKPKLDILQHIIKYSYEIDMRA